VSGRFSVVGLGPGDPELVTFKAARVIGEADVIAFHAGVRKSSHARRIAASYLPEGVLEEELRYPVTTGTTDHPGGYAGAMADFYDETERRLRGHLEAGRHVVLVSEGDPLFYGSSMYMHDRLREDFPTEVVPGVTAFSAAEAAAHLPLVRQSDVLTVLPGTLPEAELARRLADTDGALVMKLGRTFPAVVRALEAAGRLDDAVYVERASQDGERVLPVRDVDADSVPYFSLILVPGDSHHRTRRATQPTAQEVTGELLVVGLGPGPDRWLTAEVVEALATVDHVVGYGPYVERVPQRAGLTRHSSGNTVELDRARLAFDLAARGEKVAVVSGGDAGVFGMAAAVYEVAEEFPEIRIRVLPGVSAVQAVAARAGAPIGGDFMVMSLSDRLKPWSVVERRLRAAADGDLVLAIYNPASRSRTQQVVEAQKLLLELLPADRIVVVGRDVGRAEESLMVTTLGALDVDSIDMKTLLIVGSSQTALTSRGDVWTSRGVTPHPAG
jgi:precorrin-2 C20-methyltransferase/precorrin-3B C17-methyltransferase